jgi:hypothetical protein
MNYLSAALVLRCVDKLEKMTVADLKKIYKQRSLEEHPDKLKKRKKRKEQQCVELLMDDDPNRNFLEVQEAYKVLKKHLEEDDETEEKTFTQLKYKRPPLPKIERQTLFFDGDAYEQHWRDDYKKRFGREYTETKQQPRSKIEIKQFFPNNKYNAQEFNKVFDYNYKKYQNAMQVDRFHELAMAPQNSEDQGVLAPFGEEEEGDGEAVIDFGLDTPFETEYKEFDDESEEEEEVIDHDKAMKILKTRRK